MAKKKAETIYEITDEHVELDLKSKNKTWEYTANVDKFWISQKDIDGYIKIGDGANTHRYPIIVKNDDNGKISVIAKYLNTKTNKITTIINNVNNYSATKQINTIPSKEAEIFPNQFFEIVSVKNPDAITASDDNDVRLYENKQNTTYQIGKADEIIKNEVYIYDEKGSDKYSFINYNNKNVYVQDFIGADTYDIASKSEDGFSYSKMPEIYDYNGNDKYNFGNFNENKTESDIAKNTSFEVYDYKGNDKINVTDGINSVAYTDYEGKDSYDFNKATVSTKFEVTDNAGNDKYTINEINKLNITDKTGNDKYTITKTTGSDSNDIDITDNKGKDTYTLNEAKYVRINDCLSDKDDYTILNSKGVHINEGTNDKKSGNDKYKFTDSTNSAANDYDGKDSYTVSGGSVSITDFKGNDKYKATSNKDHEIELLTLSDNSGKDAYTVSGAKATKTDSAVYVRRLSIKDGGEILKDSKNRDIKKSANDTYKLSYIDNSDLKTEGYYEFEDKAGDDKYAIKNSNYIRINDGEGKDTYNISGSAKTKKTAQIDSKLLKIYDEAGDDKYNLSYINNYNTEDNAGMARYYIEDVSGNDKYNVSNSISMNIIDKKGNDTFTCKNINNLAISSSASTNKGESIIEKNTFNLNGITGALSVRTNQENYDGTPISGSKKDGVDKISTDTYNVNYTGNVENVLNASIYDYDEAGDTYNVKSSKKLAVYDIGGADKYNFTKALDDSEFRVVDYLGDDKYTFSKSSKTAEFNIEDKEGNDTYTVDKLTGKYSIKDLKGENDSLIFSDKKAKIVFMANDTSLYAYDTKNGGYVVINNYFKENNTGTLVATGDGKIETIKAGKKTLSVDVTFINEVQSSVDSFLNGKSIGDILEGNGTSETQTIQNLVNIFQGKNQ